METKSIIKKEDLPLVLGPKLTFQVLNVGKNTGYALLNRPGFPSRRVGGKYLISRDALFQWLENH